VLLTTVTAILGLLPMVFRVNIDFVTREITVGAPSTQWWTQLSSGIVFGLLFATVLTLIVTPCALMARQTVPEIFRRWSIPRRPDTEANVSRPPQKVEHAKAAE
jgi:multidrug efflux pump